MPVDDVITNVSHYRRDKLEALLRPVPRDIHKGDRGGVLVVGGSWNYRGAPTLAALGALRAGAGLVVLAVPDFIADTASALLPEAIFVPLHTTNNMIEKDSLELCISEWGKRCDSAVFGPGLGRDKSVGLLTEWFWGNWNKPLLLDADALYFFSVSCHKLPERADVVITPHSGEAAVILGVSAAEINEAREAYAQQLARKADVAVLKGMRTVVAKAGENRIIDEGSPSLAVPGSGDVLSGAIGAFLASGITPFDAATAGALLHAAAGSDIEARQGTRGALAREIADALPYAF